ncbi:MAG: zinc-ribbon domain-containing protein [Oscillospiraceae bacterium]|nr:zinc-ribbon domain-containing protein [Oscillospiraceae bacterium]
MFCRNCGQPIRDGASFCSNCGEAAQKASGQPQQPNPQPRYPQQPYQNPNFRQNPAPVYAAPQQQSGSHNGLLIVIIVLLSLLVLIGIILLFVKPGYLLQRDGGNSEVLTAESTAAPSQPDSSSTAPSQPDGSSTAPSAETEPIPQNDAAVPESTPDYPQELIGGNNPWMYSTNERPTMQEFEWCIGQFGFIRQTPEGADMISDVQGYTGGWKAMIIYNPDDPDGYFTRELDNIYISVDDSNLVQLTIDWYLLAPDFSEITNEEDMEDTDFSGAVTNTGISANGPALISIDNFWNGDGKQYAVGSMTLQNGSNAYIAMVRP